VPQTLADLLPTLAELAANRDERRSLAELAREAGTSASTFQRAFSRLVGESPKQYMRRLQLESAALELIATTRSVLDVALDAGFDSHEGFTRVFASHFGIPPREFRQRHAHLATSDAHAVLVDQLGPCIGLFRAPLTDHEDTTMSYDITQQHIEPSTFLYKAARCSHADIAKTLAGLLGGVFQHAMKHGLELRSPPTTLYQEWGPGMVTIHAGMMVAAAGELPDGLHVATLPACDAAVTIHTGPYDGLGDAHAAVEQFCAEHGLDKAGPAREVYLTDPGEVPDPRQWKTQLVWPIQRART
jgi:AraC family transcriptional regulator